VVGILGGLLVPEAAYFLGAMMADPPPAKGDCAVLVLGFPGRPDGSPHMVQRIRVRIGVRMMREAGCSRLVLSGGTPHSDANEAQLMAGLAREEGVKDEEMFLELNAKTTWENLQNSLPYMEDYPTVYVASDGLHSHRGVRYLCAQRPDRCDDAYAVANYRPFRAYFLKWPGFINEVSAVLIDAAFDK